MSQYMSLYRKWRPTAFADVVGQDHIIKVLRSEIMQGSVSHAYLFCGSRGTGKTTCAKILAKAVSCENPIDGDPCGVCEKCKGFENSFDIVEMDAASNNGVDDIRELQDRISFLPIEMKRRVYIIDEVHMLSTGAFNALLKTLEEPPEHIMFILATTESHKIPATILSRCKRFDFRRIGIDDITDRLEYISQKEEIGIDRVSLKLIATLATGAMRDALSMLELFVGAKNVTRQVVEKSLGVVGNEIVLKLLYQIADRDTKGALELVGDSYNSSKDPGVLCSELGGVLRDLLVMKYASGKVSTLIDSTSDVIETLRNVEEKFTSERLLYCMETVENAVAKLSKPGLSGRTVLEIMIMRLCDSRLSTSPEAMLERISALESMPRTVAPANQQMPEKRVEKQEKATVKEDVPPFDFEDVPPPEQAPWESEPYGKTETYDHVPRQSTESPSQMIAFGDILEEVKNRDVMAFSFMNDAKAYLDGNVMTVKMKSMGYFMFEADSSKKELVSECANKFFGHPVTVNFVLYDDEDDEKGSSADFPIF